MRNIVASVQTRLKNTAREQGTPFNVLLEHFALGRLFARLSQSPYADQLVLKGAQLFRIWSDSPHRPTRDVDFLSYGTTDTTALATMFDAISQVIPTEADGLTWLPAEASAIREENAYGGVRVKMIAQLGKMRIPLQIDVGFGDAVTPATESKVWSSLLDYANVSLTAYPIETVVAEKLEAMVSLGMANSRMKDFYDLHWISRHRDLAFDILSEAVTNTFQRRKTAIPTGSPIALTTEFSQDTGKTTQWNAFIKKNKLPRTELTTVIKELSSFLLPLMQPTTPTPTTWNPTAGWQ